MTNSQTAQTRIVTAKNTADAIYIMTIGLGLDVTRANDMLDKAQKVMGMWVKIGYRAQIRANDDEQKFEFHLTEEID